MFRVEEPEEKKRAIPFSPPDISDSEIDEVIEVLKSGWITTGPRTKELERRLAEYCNTSRAVCLNSATAAEELNFRICGIGEGDEVIVPAYTYTATAAAAVHCGAKVIFVDSRKDSTEMDYDKLYEAAERNKDLFRPSGNTELGDRIQKAIGRVRVFSDAAHALGASRKGKMAGSIADFTSFSFHAVKNLTTGEGGASI